MHHPVFVRITTFWIARLGATRPTGVGILSVVLALSVALTSLVATATNGIAIAPDSVRYIAAARNMSAGNGLTLYDSSPLLLQAPLFPVVLSLIERQLGLDPTVGVRYLNAGLFGLIVYLSGLLFRRRLIRPSTVIFGMLAVSLSPVLFRLSTFALTELLFIFWTLVFLLLLESYLIERSVKLLLLLSVITSLATMTRYTGTFCAVTGVVAILYLHKGPLHSKLTHLIVYCVISAVPLGAWAARNFVLANTLLGHRDPSTFPLHHNLYFPLVRVLSWILPLDYLADNLESTKAHFVLGSIAGFLLGLPWSPGNFRQVLRPAFRRIGPELLFTGIYLTLLVLVSTFTAHDGINHRLMSPVYVPFVLIVLFIVEQRLAGTAAEFSIRLFGYTGILKVRQLTYVILYLWLAIPSLQVAHTAAEQMRTGLGFSHISWRTSETVSYLREEILSNDDDSPLYSNYPDAIYILSGASVSFSPAATGYASSEPRRPVSSIVGTWPGPQPAYLVWFHDTIRVYQFETAELEQVVELSVVAELTDGTIYRVSAR
ncbi:MAG: phospholipid carrier-dependent glycosyltransferase [Caldilineaceae bacterium]|nr:phospholipid carrier-dependent glycosyltransferase [Caldilineaceae bacterium]